MQDHLFVLSPVALKQRDNNLHENVPDLVFMNVPVAISALLNNL